MNLIMKFGEFLHKNFEDFTKPFVLTLAFFGIVFAIIGHYGTIGFNWKLFELPLYLFWGWALYATYKLYKRSKDISKYNKEHEYE